MIILYIHSRIDRQNKTYKWNNVHCYWKLDGNIPHTNTPQIYA